MGHEPQGGRFNRAVGRRTVTFTLAFFPLPAYDSLLQGCTAVWKCDAPLLNYPTACTRQLCSKGRLAHDIQEAKYIGPYRYPGNCMHAHHAHMGGAPF